MLFFIPGAVDKIESLIKFGKQLWNLRWRVLKVVVKGNNDFLPRVEDAREQGVVLPVVPHQINTSYLRMQTIQPFNGIPSSVRAAVVDEENFKNSIFSLKRFRDVLTRGSSPCALP